jgi:hypothetical protein
MLTNQGNTVTAGTQDFSGAAHTLPMKSGLTANLPSLCATGELYFATDAPPGQNTYGCTATDTWSIQGNLTVRSDDSTVGQRGAINFEAGAGIATVMTDTGSEIGVLLGLDTAVVQTPWGEQTGSALLCASNSGSSSTYLCSLQPTLQVYTTGMTLHWTPDVDGAGGPTTLNVDTLGAVPVMQADGATNPSATQIPAGQMQTIWYDGTSFRLIATSTVSNSNSNSNIASTTSVLKGDGSGDAVAAVPGSDYAPATSGTAILKSNGRGGFSAASAGTDYAAATNGTAGQALTGNGSGGFGTPVALGALATAGYPSSGVVKSNGSAFSPATSGTDYAPATSGTAILKGNGSGGFSSAMAGTDYQAPGSYITGLTGDVTANGPGTVAASVTKVNGGSIPASATLVGTDSSGRFTSLAVTSLPATCTPGGAPSVVAYTTGGSTQVCTCTGTNTWTCGGSTGGSNTNGTNGQALTSNGSGGFGTPVTFGGAATLGVGTTSGTVAAGNASTTVNGQSCALGSTCTVADSTKVPIGTLDILRFSICIIAGCGSETTINYIAAMGAGSFTECAFNLAVAPSGSSGVIVDVQDGNGNSILAATKLVVPQNSTSVVFQGTFANSPQNYARGSKYKAVVLQNDSGGTAQGGAVQCR